MKTQEKQEIIAALIKAKRPDLANAVSTVTVQAQYQDWLPKAVNMIRILVKAMIKDRQNEEQIAEALKAVIQTALPQNLQLKVMRALKIMLAQPKPQEE